MSQTESNQPADSAQVAKGFKELTEIPARQVFLAAPDAAAAATAYLQKIMATPDADKLPAVVYGLDSATGEIDWSKYAGQDIYVIMLRNKGVGYRALVVQPAPLSATKIGKAAGDMLGDVLVMPWIADLIETQIAHKMVRTLRAPKGDHSKPITDAEINQIPHSIADYVASHRLGGAVALWNKNAKIVIDAMAQRIPAFAAQRFTKDLLRKAIESKPFADAIYPSLEAHNLFVKAAKAIIDKGTRDGSDTSLIQSWLADRATKSVAEVESSEGMEDFDSDDITFDD